MTSQELSDRVIICTGGGNGIGAEVAQSLAAQGARILVVDLDNEAAQSTVSKIINSGGAAVALAVDITDEDAVAEIASHALQVFGRIDGLYNGAGVADPTKLFHEQTASTWRRVIDINVLGSVFCMNAVIPALRAAGGGVIVNVSSGAGLRATDTGHAPYITSKHAVVGFTKAAALDLAPFGIRVNAIAPGPTLTSMVRKYIADKPDIEAHLKARILLGRLAEPSEIAQMVLFLFSDRASFCTGAIYEVNGGELAH